MNVPATPMAVTLMSTVRTPKDPTIAPAHQDIMETENTAYIMQVSMFRLSGGEGGGGKGAAFEFFCIFMAKFPTLGTGK